MNLNTCKYEAVGGEASKVSYIVVRQLLLRQSDAELCGALVSATVAHVSEQVKENQTKNKCTLTKTKYQSTCNKTVSVILSGVKRLVSV